MRALASGIVRGLYDACMNSTPNERTNVPKADYPKIMLYTGMHDAGPADPRPNGTCPHCGAEGRYTYFFRASDGNEYGAMSGCLKLFPVSEIALEQKRLMDKRRTSGRTNSWDDKAQDAINRFAAGDLDEDEALRIIRAQRAACAAWVARKYRR